jgi:hypothetical protein
MNRNTMKSVGAILAGLVAGVLVSIGTDLLMQKLGVFPGFDSPFLFTTWMLVLATLYRSVYSVGSSYLAAALAPNRPMQHAMILGTIGFVVSIIGFIVMRERSASAPWYPIALIVLALPCAWMGGKLFVIRRSTQSVSDN